MPDRPATTSGGPTTRPDVYADVHVLADAVVQEPDARAFLPRRPAIRRAPPDGRPAVSLVVVLARSPRPDETSIVPLITRGVLSFTVGLAVPDSVAAAADAAGLRPVFAQPARFGLRDQGTELARGEAFGSGAFVAVQAHLDTGQAQRALAMVSGAPSAPALTLCAAVTYRAPTGLRTATLCTPLSVVFDECLQGLDRDDFISLVATDSDGTTHAVPRLLETQRTRDVPGNGRAIRLAKLPDGVQSLSLALVADRTSTPNAHELVASDFTARRVTSQAHLGVWAADDVVLTDGADAPPEPQSLPIVNDASAPIWADRLDATRYWYAPGFELVQPQPNDDVANSAFLFSFATAGVTSGQRLGTALTATVHFTLKQIVPPAVTTALAAAGSPTASPVPLGNLSVLLSIPFRDEQTSELHRQSFAATAEQTDETITVSVELLNDWVRLAYGALAYPGFQPEPARVEVAYAYSGYVPVPTETPPIVYGGKIETLSMVPLQTEIPPKIPNPTYVVENTTVLTANSRLQLRTEAPLMSRAMPGRATWRESPPFYARNAARSARTQRALPGNAIMQYEPIAIRPEMTLSPDLIQAIRRTDYAQRSFVRTVDVDATFACSSLGAFYRQQNADGSTTAVGCQDALKLGEAALQMYGEMAELADPHYRVFRSLQQPGRFLLLPLTFRVTRYGPAETADRAYRPVIVVYATLDPDPTKSRYFFTATLQPDVSYFARRALLDRLVDFTTPGHTPTLDLPTAPSVQASATYRWAVPDVMSQPQVLAAWDSFQVSVSTGLTDALTLSTIVQASGLVGTVSFALPDGTTLPANLVVDTQIIGPWDGGPVSVQVSGDTVTLKNHIESPVSVTELVAGDNRVTVDATIEPGATTTVTAPGATSSAYPVYSVTSEHLPLQQLDIFTEDLTAQVLFVNLVNYANHQLATLDLSMRLTGTSVEHHVSLAENQTSSVDVVFPLDTYLHSQAIEFCVTKTTTDGQTAQSAWISWDLAQGTVINLTWDRIQ